MKVMALSLLGHHRRLQICQNKPKNLNLFFFTPTHVCKTLNAWLWCPWGPLSKQWISWPLGQWFMPYGGLIWPFKMYSIVENFRLYSMHIWEELNAWLWCQRSPPTKLLNPWSWDMCWGCWRGGGTLAI